MRAADPRRRGQLVDGRLANALDAAEVTEQLALAARADARDVGERGAEREAAAAVAVEADGEAVGLVAQLLQDEHLGAVGADRDGVLGVGEKHAVGASVALPASRPPFCAWAARAGGVGSGGGGGASGLRRHGVNGDRSHLGCGRRTAPRRAPPRAPWPARRSATPRRRARRCRRRARRPAPSPAAPCRRRRR